MSTESNTAVLVNMSAEKWPPRHRTYFGSLQVRPPEPGEPYAITPVRGCTGVMDLGDKRAIPIQITARESPKTSRAKSAAIQAKQVFTAFSWPRGPSLPKRAFTQKVKQRTDRRTTLWIRCAHTSSPLREDASHFVLPGGPKDSGVGMGFVVHLHEMANRHLGIPLSRRKRCMAKQFLDRPEVSSVGQQVRGKGVPQRMRVHVPIDVRKAHIFFYNPTNGSLRQTTPHVIQKNRFGIYWLVAADLLQQMFPSGPVGLERFLCLRTVRHDTLFLPLAADVQDALFLLHGPKVEPRELADAEPRCIKQLEQRAITAQEQDTVVLSGARASDWRSNQLGPLPHRRSSPRFGLFHIREIVQEQIHFFLRKHRRNALREFWRSHKSGGILLQEVLPHAVFEEGTYRGQFSPNRTFLKSEVM
jgi:hypothetical protein